MAFNLGGNTMMIGMQILGVAMQAMTEAEAPNGPFSGHGTGEQKKAFVMKRARDIMKTQDMINADLMTTVQEDATLVTFDKGVEFVFSAWETSKLFQAAPPAV